MVEFSFTHGQLLMIGILALVILGLTAFVAMVWYHKKLSKKIRKKYTTKPKEYADFLKGGAPRFVMECSTATLSQAHKIMRKIYKTMRTKGEMTLADYYRCFGEKCEFSDEAWGWADIPENSMYPLMIDGKYHVMMPELEPLKPKPIDPELELEKRVPEVTLESLQRDIEMIKVSIGYDWNGDLREIPIGRIDDAEGDIHVLQEHMKMLSQELKAFKDDANNRIENLQQRVHLNSNNIERNSEHCECLFNISRDNLGEFKEQMDTIVQEIHDEMDKLQRRLDGLSDRLEKESCDLYNEIENNSEISMSAYGRLDERMNQMMNAIVEAAKEDDQETRDVAKELDDLKRSMGDITEEVYAYRDLTDKMDTQLMSHSVKFKDVAKDIEDLRRHSNEGTDKLIQIEDEQERMGNRFSWMKTAIAKQLIQTNSLRDDIEAVGAVRQELTGKIKKLKKKLRRMEVGQTNGNQ